LIVWSSGGVTGGRWPGGGGGGGRRTQAFPSIRAFGPPGPQTFKRIDDEWQTLKINFDFFNCIGGSELVDRGYSQNRADLETTAP